MADDKILTRAEADAAIALFDDFNDRSLLTEADKHPAFQKWREEHGTAALRDLCISDAPKVEEIWCGLTSDEQESLVWDFEFMVVINDMRDFAHGGGLPSVDACIAGVRLWLAEHCPDDTLKGLPMAGQTPPLADQPGAGVKAAQTPPPLPEAAPLVDTPEARAAGLVVSVGAGDLPGFEHILIFGSYAGRDAAVANVRAMGFFAHCAPAPVASHDAL